MSPLPVASAVPALLLHLLLWQLHGPLISVIDTLTLAHMCVRLGEPT
ncbi:hypothetical protein [Streptomyces boncukensis]|uniref:Uncharacterized protein n=1 Tax=Streptomyces boncukensis TaxID=2711219 RepID=A0A6G4X2R5_9ACTN|nr:hypothetical protein [Streptomyces boncukensis]NGO71836.1 hypothetical protein [Streptomyces boncukensis]